MHEHLGASDGVGTGDLGVEDLFGRDGGQAADLGVGDGEDTVQAIDPHIVIPDVIGAGPEQGDKPAIAQHDLPGRRDHKGTLEVQTRKVRILLVCVAG